MLDHGHRAALPPLLIAVVDRHFIPSTLKGWVDLRLGRRRGTGARSEEVGWLRCFPRRGVQDTWLSSDDPRSAEPIITAGSLTCGLSDVRQHIHATW